MAKIHTHYDNLKVARMAPQEVIRAAYKALSQKYHPDKNPGDEKAARIMAIVNSAYLTLSDPQRRKEHDEWIAAEEWEVEWLESTRHEEAHGHAPSRDKRTESAHAWDPAEPAGVRPRRRGWRLWGGMAACLLLGWAGGVTMVAEPHLLSSMLASAWGSKGDPAPAPAAAAPPPAKPDTPADAWAVSRAYYPEAAPLKAAPIKVLALPQVVLPGALPDCDSETQTLVAPNGEPWPTESGYVEGFPVANKGDDMQLTLDNSGNASAVFIKVYDMERHSNVRYAYVQAHGKLLLDKLASGRYEIRYQNIDLGANQTGCPRRQANAGGVAALR